MKTIISIFSLILASISYVHAQEATDAMYLWNPGQQEASNVYNLSDKPALGRQGNTLVLTLEGKKERIITFTPGMKITFGKAVDSTGDVNHDGKVNHDDIKEVVEVICGSDEKHGADVNKDAKVDVNDVTKLTEIICK